VSTLILKAWCHLHYFALSTFQHLGTFSSNKLHIYYHILHICMHVVQNICKNVDNHCFFVNVVSQLLIIPDSVDL
jgi:hypothetical protein